jgi:hypothetical protein
MRAEAQSHNIEVAAPTTKCDMLMLIVIVCVVSTIAGFLAANYF